ncbi:MAG: bacillithiol biosynthesis deacetylase BshB1, partial [Marinoscillum sp.]
IDLTRGEMGTRGSAEQRSLEAANAAEIMGLTIRENMGFADGFFANDATHQMALIGKIRKFQPDIILTNAIYDRHPDHGRGAELVEEATFKAGLKKIETFDEEGNPQAIWRPKKLYFSVQSTSIAPSFFVDISSAHELKMEAIRAYKSQFFDPNSKEPETYIAKPEFMEMVEARAREYGHRIGVRFAEGFISKEFLGVKDLYHLI